MKKVLSIFGVLVFAGTVAFASNGINPVEGESGIKVVKRGSTLSVFYNNTEASLVRISISDESGQSVFTDYVRSKKGFVRPYNISALSVGTYLVTVTDKAGNEYKEKIAVSENSFAYSVRRIGSENKYALFVPASGAKGLEVFIYNKDGVLIYRKTEKVSADFAKVYNLRKHAGEAKIVVLPVL